LPVTRKRVQVTRPEKKPMNTPMDLVYVERPQAPPSRTRVND